MTRNGLLVVNSFLTGIKYDQLNEYLCRAASRIGASLKVFTNGELLFNASTGAMLDELPDFDFCIFWDKDVRLGAQLERLGLRLFNSSEAVRLCDDKSLTHLALSGRVPMPDTIIAPMTFSGVGYRNTDFMERVYDELGFPFVIKECFGSFGAQVYLASDRAGAQELLSATQGRPLLFQRFISESAGTDIRINVVGGQAVAAMRRENHSGDFRANITNGGTGNAYSPTREQIDIAQTACSALGVEFAGVDLLESSDGPLLCEVNSNAHFKSIYECTGVELSTLFLEYIEREVYG